MGLCGSGSLTRTGRAKLGCPATHLCSGASLEPDVNLKPMWGQPPPAVQAATVCVAAALAGN
jgi:hypothetical protein